MGYEAHVAGEIRSEFRRELDAAEGHLENALKKSEEKL